MYLEQLGVTTEMYAIPWFVTYLATRMPHREVLLEFWERIVNRDEPPFIYFFLTSFVIFYEETIKMADMANLPVIMANLDIRTHAELDRVWMKAEDLLA